MSISKQMHAGFTDFFARPSSETLRALIKNNIGETNEVDFKEVWPEKGKLAKHVLALANSGGGVLIIGVKDGEQPVAIGLEIGAVKDKTVVGNMVKALIPSSLSYDVFDFSYRESENSELKGKAFQVLIVDSRPSDLPYLATKNSGELKANAIYVRSNSSTNEATHEELQSILDSRIGTQEAAKRLLDLGEHCEQLKMLYSQLPIRTDVDWLVPKSFYTAKHFARFRFDNWASNLIEDIPKRPTYEDFINQCIDKKKKRIELELDI